MEDSIYNAKLAEQAEMYDDMVKHMKDIVMIGNELTNENRNLLSVAFKNQIGTRRTAWRAITAIEQKEEAKGNSKFLELLRSYKAKIEKEVEAIVDDITSLLDKYLIPKAGKAEGQVFYLKMKGDYYRYLAECTSGEVNKTAGEKGHESYKKATEKAFDLPTTHPSRLGRISF